MSFEKFILKARNIIKDFFKKGSIIKEVALLFLVGILTTGILTYFSESRLYSSSVKEQTEIHAEQVAEEAKLAVLEYPAHQWLIKYWYEHPDTMDIEYDARFTGVTETEEKCRIFNERHPKMQLRYLNSLQCSALSAEDQKLYAEITYSWLISRIDQIKRSYNVDFLFCVISEEPYESQFFLFSGADVGAVRGTTYEEVYPLGHVVSVSDTQRDAMREATKNERHLADAGIYVDYYALINSFEGHSVLIGVTYGLSDLQGVVSKQTRSGSSLAMLNQIVLSLICLGLIFVFVLDPLKKVQHNIRCYKETKESDEVIVGLDQIKSSNEIGRLAEDVSDMVREIDAHMDQIETFTAERERIVTELSLAAKIQADMLPSSFPAFPDREDFDIYASMDPAKEVGGDFYNFFLVDDDHLCLIMADVSGKGIPAALFMMASMIILANNAKMGKTPAEILTDSNASICAHNREEMFVTVWLGILELSTGKLTAANAGHEYPVIKNPDGRFELYKDKHGFVMGGMDGIKYKEYELSLEPGSKLFLYTDGVPEATNGDNVLFGVERMLYALNNSRDCDPEHTLENVRKAVDGFVQGAEQFDDLTMLCLEYKGEVKSS